MDQQNRAARKKYHVIYKTTCLVSHRYYIGMHSTDNLDDGYLGSGKRLWQSIRKHGKENHVYEIQEKLPSREELRLREAELVNEILLEDKQCMNLCLGGNGGWNKINETRWAEIQKMGYKAMVAVLTPEQRSRRAKHAWTGSEAQLAAVRSAQKKAIIAAALPEANDKRKATLQAMKHQQGEANSQYGKVWVTNGSDAKLVKLDQLPAGFIVGRVIKESVRESQASLLAMQRQEDYLRLSPRCRNKECGALLSLHAFRKKRTSCSKACSNKTRITCA